MPAPPKLRAIARPMPLAAPVITATLPSTDSMNLSFEATAHRPRAQFRVAASHAHLEKGWIERR
jgi:hypothetical protein